MAAVEIYPIIPVLNEKILESDVSTLNIDEERWVLLSDIGQPNYQISSHSRILNRKTLRFLTGSVKKDGYRRVSLSNNGKSNVYLVHRLVAIAFIPNANSEKLTVDHIDRNRDNNHVSNLRWSNLSEQATNQNRGDRKGIGRSVSQYDLCENFIRRWDNASEAETLGISVSQIIAACKGRKEIAGGFIWKYADMKNLEGEEWKILPYEEFGYIQGSNKGRIKRSNGKITTGYLHNGYWTISFKDINTGKRRSVRVHRLIISGFQGRKDDMQVNHIDGNPLNNAIENLEYITQQQNVIHAIQIGLKPLDKVKTRAVISTDKDGNECRYDSIKLAANAIGVDPSSISTACSGRRKTSAGLKWRYECDVSSYLI